MPNSKSKNSKNQKNTLTKEEIQSIKARMARLKKENEEDSSSTQAILPYKTMFPDGTCHIGGQKYSQTVEFYDTNYQLATYEEKDSNFRLGVIFSIISMKQSNFKIPMKIRLLTRSQ